MRASDPSSARIRVGTLNVSGASRAGELADAIDGSALGDADVLMLQEIETSDSSHGPRELARALEREIAYATARRWGGSSHGIALVSRWPLSDVEVVPLPRFDLGYRSRRRVALSATVSVEGEPVRLFNVHLDTRITLGERIRQMEPVLSTSRCARRSIVGGDFNTIRAAPFLLPWIPLPLPLPFPGWNQASGFDEHMLRRGFERSLPDVGATGPLGMRLDAVYHRGFESSDHGVVAFPTLSDHLALWVDLRMAPPSRDDGGG